MVAEKKSKKGFAFEMIMLKQRKHWTERGVGIIFSVVMIAIILAASFLNHYLIDILEANGIYLDLSMYVLWILVLPFIVNILIIRWSLPCYAVTDTRVVMTEPYSSEVAWAIPLREIVRAEQLSPGKSHSDINILTQVSSGSRLMITKEGEFGITTLQRVAKPDTFVNTLNAARRSLGDVPA